MPHAEFDSAAYLKRLNLSAPVEPTVEGLHTLQQAQFFTIPFENFDIQLGRGVNLDLEYQFDKLVRRPRGGYCFELNGLLLRALHAFGFEARALLARVHLSGTPSGRGHQISLVEIDGKKWIADVGFGRENPRGPMLLEWDRVQEFLGVQYRFIDGGPFGTMLQKQETGEWKNLYSFDMEHVFEADRNYGNHFASTYPGGLFVANRVAMRPLEDGMVTLFNHGLTTRQGDQEAVVELPQGQAYLDALKTHFNIELDEPYEALKPVAHE